MKIQITLKDPDGVSNSVYEAVRAEVNKLRLSDEMDPEKLFSDEFDDRLKVAEEDAKKVA